MASQRKNKGKNFGNYNPKNSEKEYDSDSDDDILKENVKKVNEWYSYFNEHIERARNYLTFLYVDQWDVNIRQARESLSRPTMEFNKLTTVIRAILGEQRNNSPALTVRGVGKKTQQSQVDVVEGLIAQIHYDSDADIAYQIASKHGLECGWGAARVVAEYEPNSFKQYLSIKGILDFQAAFWDPTAQESNKSDGDYCGVYTVMSKEKFKKLYPDVENPEDVSGITNNYYIQWNTRDTVMLAEMYYKEYYNKKIVQLSDGNEVDEDKAKEILEMQEKFLSMNPDADILGFKPLEIVNERTEKDYKIKHMKFVQNAILDEVDYPGKILPIPYFEGDSAVIDGEQIPIPYVQDAIDTQKLINYIGSEIAYSVLRSRKETVIGTPDNFKGFEDDWINPDRVQGYLEFNYDRNGGKPEFINPPVFNQSFLLAYDNCTKDLMQVLGRFEESRGQESNAMSGKAINARQRAANNPVNLYDDNNQRGIKQIGKILLDMIPHIYDTEREIMIRGRDNKSKSIEINKQKGYRMLPDGGIEANVENDITTGKYDIEIRVDGSYDAQQAEAMDILIRLATINPQISNLIPDLLAEVSGLENTQQLVERLRTLVPPQIIAKEQGLPLPPPPSPPIDPMVELQKQSLALEAQKNAQDNATKQRQLEINEQKLLIDANKAGIQNEVTMTKAAAEIHKANVSKDIAILNHANSMRASQNGSF